MPLPQSEEGVQGISFPHQSQTCLKAHLQPPNFSVLHKENRHICSWSPVSLTSGLGTVNTLGVRGGGGRQKHEGGKGGFCVSHLHLREATTSQLLLTVGHAGKSGGRGVLPESLNFLIKPETQTCLSKSPLIFKCWQQIPNMLRG